MNLIKKAFLGLGVVFIIIQFVPVKRENLKPTAEIQAPEEIKQILKRSCYDCHSYETRWPWYSYVAPISWGIAHDVNEAREHMNFSIWESFPNEDLSFYKKEIHKQLEKGKMPLPRYLLLHPEAKLTQTDLQALKTWTGPLSESKPDSQEKQHHHDHKDHDK